MGYQYIATNVANSDPQVCNEINRIVAYLTACRFWGVLIFYRAIHT
ncbi:MAG: hypothetical protein LBN71_08370 [Tannerella sp.]|nr:hypothetical protein [Tannerella sp.]